MLALGKQVEVIWNCISTLQDLFLLGSLTITLVRETITNLLRIVLVRCPLCPLELTR
jgi:hypothetical protein